MRRAALTIAVLAALVIVATAAQAQTAGSGAGSQPTRAVVMVSTPDLPSGSSSTARSRWHQLRSDSRGILDQVAERNDLRVESSNPEIGALSVDLGPGGLPALRTQLADDPKIQAVRPDVPVQLRYSPSDYAFSHQDVHAPNGDFGQWNLVRVGAPRAWDLSKGTGAEVAVVDTGADGSNPDLARRIAGGASFGTGTSPTTDSDGHGTHTAGLACGDSDNSLGIASTGFHCSLFIAKIGGFCSDVANGITAAANRNSDVISMSLGACPPDPISSALSYAQSRNSVLVAAGDNNPNPSGYCGGLLSDPYNCLYPEEWVQPKGTGPTVGFDRGLVVTAAKYDGTRASFAEATARVSVAAFGAASDVGSGGQQGILSTWPGNSTDADLGTPGTEWAGHPCGCRTSVAGDNRFAYLVGTSMATPQVAGVAALIRSVKPEMANTKVVHLIKATASHCGSYGDGTGWGVIRADQAVAAALDRDVNPPNSRVAGAKRAQGRVIVLKLKRGDPKGGGCVKLPVAGVKKVLVFASANGGPYHRIGKTTAGKLRFHAKSRHHYRFFSIAVDKAGNREAAPSRPDAKA
jgi:subtilisin family serine protease